MVVMSEDQVVVPVYLCLCGEGFSDAMEEGIVGLHLY